MFLMLQGHSNLSRLKREKIMYLVEIIIYILLIHVFLDSEDVAMLPRDFAVSHRNLSAVIKRVWALALQD